MQTRWLIPSFVVGVFIGVYADGSWIIAAERSSVTKASGGDSPSAAAALVQQALAAESAGNLQQREDYLRQALAADPDFAPAHWQLGEVRVGKSWLAVDAASAENAWSDKFVKYRDLRDSSPATPAAHLQLARWCEDQGLKDQERLHLSAAMGGRLNKVQHRDVMNKLGLVRYRHQIMPAATAEAIKRQAKDADTAMQKWKPVLNRLRGDLDSRDSARQEAASEQMKSIGDSAAIPAIESVFAKSSVSAGKAAVMSIAAMKGQAATDSLVRHAVLAAHEEVRQAAAEALKSRDIFTYVPLLLGAMNTPIEINFQVFANEGGAFGEQLSLFREGPLYNTAVNTGLTALPNYTPDLGTATNIRPERAAQQVAAHADADAQIAAVAVAENARTEMLNKRIGAALRTSVGNEGLGDEPKEWWNWWTEYNDTHYADDKLVYELNRQSYTYYTAPYVSPTPSYHPTPQPHPQPQPQPQVKVWHFDRRGAVACFVPGTLVWTVTGTMPIEKIQPGDWVLSQDVTSGELGYKPVANVTTGPPLPLVEIHSGEQVIRCTRGHLFWVSGTGWRMARELQAGQLLHTASGAITIDSVEQTGEASCHNLIVPDFNTYFVTAEKILVHDIDFRSPTTATVPGMTGE